MVTRCDMDTAGDGRETDGVAMVRLTVSVPDGLDMDHVVERGVSAATLGTHFLWVMRSVAEQVDAARHVGNGHSGVLNAEHGRHPERWPGSYASAVG